MSTANGRVQAIRKSPVRGTQRTTSGTQRNEVGTSGSTDVGRVVVHKVGQGQGSGVAASSIADATVFKELQWVLG